jgi:hypothetical protein
MNLLRRRAQRAVFALKEDVQCHESQKTKNALPPLHDGRTDVGCHVDQFDPTPRGTGRGVICECRIKAFKDFLVDVVDLGVVLVTLGGDDHDPGIQVREMLLNRIGEEHESAYLLEVACDGAVFQFSKESVGVTAGST